MDLIPEHVQDLWRCFVDTLSLDPKTRRGAEADLAEAAARPHYGLDVLSLIAESALDEQIRQFAILNLKNHLKARWAPLPDDPDRVVLPNSVKMKIIGTIVNQMITASPKIQAQLAEALTIIGNHDFSRICHSMLPEFIENLGQYIMVDDRVSANGVLAAIDSMFKKLRLPYKTNDLYIDLGFCLEKFASTLLQLFIYNARLIDNIVASGAANVIVLKGYIESQTLCCSVFYSFNCMDLPKCFEDHMDEWMTEFENYLTVTYSSLEDSGNDGLAVVDELRAAVCDNISLYMKRYEEPFQIYLSGFLDAVWWLLVAASNSPSREMLTVSAIKFLITVSTSAHHTLFASDDCLQRICQSIVIPNVMLREEDEKLFEINYMEFMRRNMEGSGIESRRMIACELLKGIASNYKERVAETISDQLQSLLDTFSQNPAENWRHKDCAIYLVMSLATKRAAGTSVSTDIVDVGTFFESVIVPELTNCKTQPKLMASVQAGSLCFITSFRNLFPEAPGDGDSCSSVLIQNLKCSNDIPFPMLKAGALKFFTMFRNQIPKAVAVSVLNKIVCFLPSQDVVQSYTAFCIEKLLSVKDEGGRARYSAADVNTFQLTQNLFVALKLTRSPEENHYMMKCIKRVFEVADCSENFVQHCFQFLHLVLDSALQNPKNTVFNHHLFDAVGLLIRRACEHDSSIITFLNANFLPIRNRILAGDITEFIPYAMQLDAQLMEFTTIAPASFVAFLDSLLGHKSWKESAHVPALVCYLQAYIRKYPHELSTWECLSKILGTCATLVLSQSTDEQGFYVLNTVIENACYNDIAQHISDIWVTLFKRLQSNKTVKFQKSFLIFMSLFLVKYGPQNLAVSMNAAHPNIFHLILDQFWIPDLKLITGSIELKLTAVSSTRILTGSLSPLEHWGKMLNSIVTLISRSEEGRVEEEPEDPDFGGTPGYQSINFRLPNAGKKDEDPLPEIIDPAQYLVVSLADLSARSPGILPRIIAEDLEPANQATLMIHLCKSYNLKIV